MITIIFGPPGAGKTSLMSALACQRMTTGSWADIWACRKEVEKLNAGGFCLTAPKKHLTFSNMVVTSEPVEMWPRKSWYVDGFRLGLPNADYDVMFLPPYSQIFLTEGQKYYNSRESQKLSDSVSRWYETHRHYGCNVMIDCQRTTLIDLNIRGLAEEFIEPFGQAHRYDVMGNIVATSWYCRVFTNCYAVDNYLSSGKLPGDFQECVYEYRGDVFKTYDSKACRFLHYKGRAARDFDLIEPPEVDYTVGSIQEYNDKYDYEVPEGFYKATKKEREAKERQARGVAGRYAF